MRKLNLDPVDLEVQSFQPAPDPRETDANVAGSESVCMVTQICTCDFTACCHH